MGKNIKMQKFEQLEVNLEYVFKDKSLLKLALTHRSYSLHNNERLEFLGDGILDFIIADKLFIRYPNLDEGDLSKIRSELVNQKFLSMIATGINLGEYLFLGDGEEKTKGRGRASILADSFEAILAAIYLDSQKYNINSVNHVIEKLFAEHLANATNLVMQDSKSTLQEYLQSLQLKLPEYNLIAIDGPNHDSLFTIECLIQELDISVIASGRTKKAASKDAATKALKLVKARINANEHK